MRLDHTQFPGSPESELEADFSHLGLCILCIGQIIGSINALKPLHEVVRQDFAWLSSISGDPELPGEMHPSTVGRPKGL